ncbi:MAG: hypothetical protein HOE48_16625 [Candidatus Latescibacteria bacterium]|jgi:hypothetical protein|nr:hypothetical protein [Candidatus Latescibacterota bacterium]
MATTEASIGLSTKEVAQFRQDGYLGPMPLCSPEEMADIRTQIESLLKTEAPDHMGFNNIIAPPQPS